MYKIFLYDLISNWIYSLFVAESYLRAYFIFTFYFCLSLYRKPSVNINNDDSSYKLKFFTDFLLLEFEIPKTHFAENFKAKAMLFYLNTDYAYMLCRYTMRVVSVVNSMALTVVHTQHLYRLHTIHNMKNEGCGQRSGPLPRDSDLLFFSIIFHI